jgi:hypothetical protein
MVTFGISLIEKLTDWKGTIAYISEIFKTSFIKAFVKPLIAFLMLLEFLTFFFLIVGIYQLYISNNKANAILGCAFSAISIIYMLIGQRIAKDYPGATSLTVYFILSVLGVYLLS